MWVIVGVFRVGWLSPDWESALIMFWLVEAVDRGKAGSAGAVVAQRG